MIFAELNRSHTLTRHRVQTPLKKMLLEAGVPPDIINDPQRLFEFARTHFSPDSLEGRCASQIALHRKFPDIGTVNLMELVQEAKQTLARRKGGKSTSRKSRTRLEDLKTRILSDYRTSLMANPNLSAARWAQCNEGKYNAADGSGRKLSSSRIRRLLTASLHSDEAPST